jgi:hypothetical protein
MTAEVAPIANVSFISAQALLDVLREASRTAHVGLTVNLINSQVAPFLNDTRWPLVIAWRAPSGFGTGRIHVTGGVAECRGGHRGAPARGPESIAPSVSRLVKSVGKPDARNGHVRFDERGRETAGCL